MKHRQGVPGFRLGFAARAAACGLIAAFVLLDFGRQGGVLGKEAMLDAESGHASAPDVALKTPAPTAAPTAIPSAAWPLFHHDLQHTGLSPFGASANTSIEKWVFPTPGQIGESVQSSPAIGSDGTIYVGGTDFNVYAIKPNGSLKWKFPTAYVVTSSPAVGSDGTVYIGSRDANLYALKPNGSLKWKFAIIDKGTVDSSPAIGSDGTIYVGAGDGNLYALNSNGSLKWKFFTSQNAPVYSSPAIGSDGTIYVGSYDHNLYAINVDGSLKWKFATGATVASSPAIGSDGTIYVGSDDFNLYAINADGSLKWKFATGSVVTSSPAVGSDGTIYVGSFDGSLYALNADGSLKWKFTASNQPVETSPAIASDGTIYVGSDDGSLYALNPDGSQKWALALPQGLVSSPAIGADGTVYVGCDDSNVYAILGGAPAIPTPTLAPGQTAAPTPTPAPTQAPTATPTAAPAPTVAPTVVSGIGITWGSSDGTASDQVNPSGSSGALGPNHFVLKTNNQIVIYDRSGHRVAGPIDDSAFFSPQVGTPRSDGVTGGSAEPNQGRIYYDANGPSKDSLNSNCTLSGRWLLVELGTAGPNAPPDANGISPAVGSPGILIASSPGSDPTVAPSSWYQAFLPADCAGVKGCGDSPQLGWNAVYVAVGLNNYYASGPSGVAVFHPGLLVIGHDALECGRTSTQPALDLQVFANDPHLSKTAQPSWDTALQSACVTPAYSYSVVPDFNSSPIYLINVPNNSTSQIEISAVTGFPTGTFKPNYIPTATKPSPWKQPPAALSQNGSSTKVDFSPGDSRFTSCVSRGSAIWAAQTVGNGSSGTQAQWWEIGALSDQSLLPGKIYVQDKFSAAGFNLVNPSLAVDSPAV